MKKLLQKLKERGIVVFPVAQNSNYLKANFVTVDSITSNDIALLLQYKKAISMVKPQSERKFRIAILTPISQLTNLTRLQLDNTSITDKGLASLQSLGQSAIS